MIVSQRKALTRLGRIRRPAVQHVAIDLGGRESQICVRDATTKIVEERRVLTRRLGEYLSKQGRSRVILETSTEAFAVADAAMAAGHEVRVVPATLARTLGVGAHGIKTDRRDAQALSEVSCKIDLRSVHVPSKQAREWRALLSSRDALVTARTKLFNTLASQLRGRLVQLGKRLSGTTPARLRELWTQLEGMVPAHVERLLVVVEELHRQVLAATREIARLAKEHEVCRRLMTVPGIGCITALRFVATIDDVTRFSTAHAVQSYLGLTPGENSSSTRSRRTALTKAGSPQMRWLLVQAAWTTRRTAATHPIGLWAKKIAERRGSAIATVAVARKLAGVLFAIWRDKTTYDPTRGTA
jgi:transposase